MKTKIGLVLLTAVVLTFSNTLLGQTIIINEVSQGEDGSKEYIEFLVVDSTANYNCGLTTPPSIDIRRWIIDDNNGYHGSNGIASGAIRFSDDPMWASVPLGTIILVYNPDDFNPEISDGSVTLADGTCLISVAISNAQFFESNLTTPGDIACSYPQNGWVPGAVWTNISMRNGGDCARIVDTIGCEVFSVCWGDVNQNTSIYFDNSASNRVYYFNQGDPTDPANWTNGCADLNHCGEQNQTPGLPNNSANEQYIGQFNNNCMPITPISASISSNLNDCSGSTTLEGSATGSIPNYTYEWYDATFANLLGTNATLNVNASGTIQLIVTSSIGCSDTASINVVAGESLEMDLLGSFVYCEGDAIEVEAEPNITGGQFEWNNLGSTPDSIFTDIASSNTSISLSYTIGTCSIDTVVQIAVNASPVIDVEVSDTIGNVVLNVDFINNSTGPSFDWDFGNGTTSQEVNPSVAFDQPGVYTVTMTASNSGCTSTWTKVITVIDVSESLPLSYHIPNVFTPNNDGVNDLFFIDLNNANDFQCTIRNRWGNKVKELQGLNASWDGTINGNEASEGVYFVYYTIFDLNGDKIEGQGFVELKRN